MADGTFARRKSIVRGARIHFFANPRKLDKEYVRTWLADQGFTGDGKPPKLTDKIRVEAAARYMEVVENFTGEEMQLEVGPVDESIYSILNPFAY